MGKIISPNIDIHLLFSNSLTVYQGIFEQGGNNRHEVIDRWNKRMGVPIGSAWCITYLCNVYLDVCEVQGIEPTMKVNAHVRSFFAQNKALVAKEIKPGFIACLGLRGSDSGHAFGVLEKKAGWVVRTCEGNTSSAGSEVNRDGDGVYIKNRDVSDLGNFDLLGFIDPFANVKT